MKKILYILFVVLACLDASANERKISFRHLNLEDGLSSISVTDVWADPSGLVWMATGSGLDCYDGNAINRYYPPQEIHRGEQDIVTRQLAGSDDGFLYILYSTKIGVLNTRTGEFRLFHSDACNYITYKDGLWIARKSDLLYSAGPDEAPYKVLSLPSDHGEITALHHTDDGITWIGTESGKICILKDGMFTTVSESLSSQIYRIYMDKRGTIWAGSLSDGALTISKDFKETAYRHSSADSRTISSNFVRDFCEDNMGNMWIGTYTGLDCLNPVTGVISRHSSEFMSHDAISHNSVWAIEMDHQGTIWIATFYGGVNYFNPEYDIYNRYPVSNIEGKGLSSPIIKKVIADKNGNLWVGTEGGGLNRIDRRTGKTTWYNTSSPVGHRLTENNIEAMVYDSAENIIWIGLHLGGVNSLDIDTGKIKVFRSDPDKKNSLPSDDVFDIADYGDSLIVRMTSHACVMDKKTGICRLIGPVCEYQRNGGYIRTSMLSDENDIWISKTNPYRLARLSPPFTHEIEYSVENSKGDCCLSEIYTLMQDKSGKIWIASKYDGLFVYNSHDDSFTAFGDDIPLKGTNCMAESEASGNIICSSDDGFVVFNPVTHNVTHYNRGNGFPLKTSYTQCITILDGSEIFIGGYGGLVSVSEDDLHIPRKPFRLFFSSLSVNGERISTGSEILPESLMHTDAITLPADTRSLELCFSSSNHIAAQNDRIRYRLEGFDDDWKTVDGERKISYTNLPAGRYRLHLNPVSVTSDICPDTLLDIRILPPWWATWYAIAVYILLVIIAVMIILQIYTNRVQLREHLKLEKKRTADLESLNQDKLRFFTNISHEIRTPLTIIIAEIESMIQQHNFSPVMYRKVLSIYKNSLSLRELISELMEFRKQEQGKLKIRVAPHNISFFINEFYLLFSEYASSKNINLSLNKDVERLEVWYDQTQMQKVLNNILSNSIKFTPEGGQISVRVYSTEASAVIEIKDTGCGIPEKDLKNIFDRFYQVEYSSEINTGTGIGLSLAQGIVKMHSGTIEVESAEGKGSLFRIILPLGYSHFSKEQLDVEIGGTIALNIADKISVPAGKSPAEEENDSRKGHTIVIAEDNPAILELLVDLFSPFYKVISATDGTSALDAVRKHLPSLVVSDILMPGMNGTQICRIIKNDPTLCHIPVVLLTARVEVEQNIEGLQQGADDYITKPFNSTLLLSRCNNLVNSRIMMQEKYGNKSEPSAWIKATNRMDNDFMEKLTSLVSSNLDNADFDINALIQAMGVSRTGFFRKLKSITGQTPTEFIQTIRLKRGAELLLNNPDMNIGEISDIIGFNTPKYFAKCFKEHFGKSPLAWRKENNGTKKRANNE